MSDERVDDPTGRVGTNIVARAPRRERCVRNSPRVGQPDVEGTTLSDENPPRRVPDLTSRRCPSGLPRTTGSRRGARAIRRCSGVGSQSAPKGRLQPSVEGTDGAAHLRGPREDTFPPSQTINRRPTLSSSMAANTFGTFPCGKRDPHQNTLAVELRWVRLPIAAPTA